MLQYFPSPYRLPLILREAESHRYLTPPTSPKLLDHFRSVMRRQHYSTRTEETYTQWIIRFIRFHNMRHPQEMDTPEIEAYLNDLALNKKVAASTQNQAFSAILFLYKQV